jgi:hypothetical protein
VKASATVRPADIKGLRQAATEDRFLRAIVLHEQDRIVPFDVNILAAPISLLWMLQYQLGFVMRASDAPAGCPLPAPGSHNKMMGTLNLICRRNHHPRRAHADAMTTGTAGVWN